MRSSKETKNLSQEFVDIELDENGETEDGCLFNF